MPDESRGFPEAPGEDAETGHRSGAARRFLTILWFGLLAGWLELGLVLTLRAINPHVSVDSLRTNRHYAWMIPVGDVILFAALGLCLAPLGGWSRGLARWLASRLPIALVSLALLLSIEGLHPIAGVVLSIGVASALGPRIGRHPERLDRLVRASLPVLALGLVVLAGTNYAMVTSAESRTLASRPPSKPGSPNVLLIVLDNVRAASMSLHGYARPTTPNLDRMAQKGVIFAEARSTAPWTLPSHASMLTGRWPHELSVGPDLPLDGTFPTLAETLGREGYATAGFVGNTTYCNALYGMGRGFARYEDVSENQVVSPFETLRSPALGKRIFQALGYPIAFDAANPANRKTAETINQDVIRWLDGRAADRPFFAFINYFDAHTPYVFRGEPAPRFGMTTLPQADLVAIDGRFWDAAAGKPIPDGFTKEQVVGEGYTLLQDSYDTCIAYLDQQIGLLMDEIERRGLLENTLVIVTSDHGEQFGERGIMGHGASLYRREVHVPLLVIPPARSATPMVVAEPVSNREIAATVAEWLDLGPKNPFPGQSLTRFLSTRSPEESPVLCEVQHIETLPRLDHLPSTQGPVNSLVSRNRVYIRSQGGREELYDSIQDELERVDLAKYPEYRQEVDRLREELSRLCPDSSSRPRGGG